LRGNHPEHELLEDEARRFFGSERALFFSSGYDANVALFATLPRRGDLVIHDDLIHASVRDGLAANRAEHLSFPHNDAAAVDDALRTWRARGGTGVAWIVCESLYSMDGDRAPLRDLCEIANQHDATLVIDEAHATGVFGPDGRGFAAQFEGRDNIIVIHTAGKALGVSGALVTAPAIVCDDLINRARPFIYSTAPSPLVAAAVRASLRIARDDAARRDRHAHLVQYAGSRIESILGRPWPGSQIIPLIVGGAERALSLAAALQAEGYDVRAIRPRAVPIGTARLRVSITLHVDEPSIDGLITSLERLLN
jgi:8-amino-7-oxononanoate synthase